MHRPTLSPLDGRYSALLDPLREYFSEDALFRARAEVEIRYFIALSELKEVEELSPVTAAQKKALLGIVENFSSADVERIRQIESTTRHDVKAVEYWLKEKMAKIAGLKSAAEFIHFALTSEDVNNLSYGILINAALERVLIPAVHDAEKALGALAAATRTMRMLSLTHGQPATPTTLGKEMTVFVSRLQRQVKQAKAFRMQGKLGGAVGNFSAHKAAYPAVKWETFRLAFVKSLGLEPLLFTTQINPHDDIAELSHIFIRINAILLDASRDFWMYISRGVFRQKVVKGEVGSSTMPHKVNPIDFENAEGNVGLSTALFGHFAEKLPVSRLQRDLSDSTVQRSIGVAFGYHYLAVKSFLRGLSKVTPDPSLLAQELRDNPEVIAEAIQTVLRKHGVSGAYEKLKELTRGAKVSVDDFAAYINTLRVSEEDKETLRKLLP